MCLITFNFLKQFYHKYNLQQYKIISQKKTFCDSTTQTQDDYEYDILEKQYDFKNVD